MYNNIHRSMNQFKYIRKNFIMKYLQDNFSVFNLQKKKKFTLRKYIRV